MSLMLKDPGTAGAAGGAERHQSGDVHAATASTYRRADGRNTPGVDVPYAVRRRR